MTHGIDRWRNPRETSPEEKPPSGDFEAPSTTQEGAPRDAIAKRVREDVSRGASSMKQEKSPSIRTIEEMLSEGLKDIFLALSEEGRRQFRHEGELLALWIDEEMRSQKLSSKALLHRVERWLKIVDPHRAFSPWRTQQAYNAVRDILVMYRDGKF